MELETLKRRIKFVLDPFSILFQLSDPMGEATAKMNITDLKKILNIDESPDNNSESSSISTPSRSDSLNNQFTHRLRRESMEQLSLIKVNILTSKCIDKFLENQSYYSQFTPDGKHPGLSLPQQKTTPSKPEDEDSFFDLLSRFQSKRMDDQRCSLNINRTDVNKENRNANLPPRNDGPEELIDMIAGIQSKRMDEQRVSLPHLPGEFWQL